MDKLGIASAAVTGNSMGGRIAMEMAMRKPHRVDAIACLCPAAAFSERPWLRLVRFVRPELTLVAPRIPRGQVLGQLRQLFADPDRLHPEWYEAAVDEFRTIWREPRARIAFARSLRNIYLDEPEGDHGFWSRLRNLEVPALYIYGKHDVLITHHFARKVARHILHARVLVWNDCGHVPQIEFPDRTVAEMLGHFAAASRRREPRRAAIRTG
jgi:pimeloyl-ACP methyl ester carboxylesterase